MEQDLQGAYWNTLWELRGVHYILFVGIEPKALFILDKDSIIVLQLKLLTF